MGESNLIINNRELNYEGIFKVDELFKAIDKSLQNKGYTKVEKKTEEEVVESGKRTYIELRPFKDMSNYVQLMIKIKISLDEVKDVVREKESGKEKFQEGKVRLQGCMPIQVGYTLGQR